MERKIPWQTQCFDEIELVYQKAAQNETIAALLSELETRALQEAEESCSLLQIGSKRITRERFLRMSQPEKEAVLYHLASIGLQDFSAPPLEPTISVTFSPYIQKVLACTMFSLLNRLEKLDGAVNAIFSEVTLKLWIPLGGKTGFVKCNMLILLLYPWLKIQEGSTDTLSCTLPVPKPPAEPPKKKPSFFAKWFSKDT